MTYKKLTQYILITTFLFLFSCDQEKEIDYKLYYPGDKIVIHGYLSEAGIELYVNKTLPPTAIHESNRLDKVSVALFENNEFLLYLTNIKDDLYKTPKNFTPQKNKSYYIEVEADNLPRVKTKEQYLLTAIKIDTSYYQKSGESEYNLITSFIDPFEELNYYSDKFYQYAGGENIDSLTYSEFINPYTVFGDNNFNGEEKKINNEFYKNSFSDNTPLDSIQVVLYSISEDTYLHLSSIKDYEISRGDPWFEQPAVIYSNILNGYGIFGSFATDTVTVVINIPK